MRIVALVQARMSSRRLPGKVLLPLAGRPLIGHLFEALAACRSLDGMVLATSVAAEDDAVAAFALGRGIACFRGPLDDVAGRLLGAGRSAGADAMVRVNGDSPLLDPALVDQGVALFRASAVDVVTNVRPRSFPKGQSVEVIRISALARAHADMTAGPEHEHVTPHLYDHPDRYLVSGFHAERPRPELQLSVDEAEDLRRCEAVLQALDRPPWEAGWEACVAAADAFRLEIST